MRNERLIIIEGHVFERRWDLVLTAIDGSKTAPRGCGDVFVCERSPYQEPQRQFDLQNHDEWACHLVEVSQKVHRGQYSDETIGSSNENTVVPVHRVKDAIHLLSDT